MTHSRTRPIVLLLVLSGAIAACASAEDRSGVAALPVTSATRELGFDAWSGRRIGARERLRVALPNAPTSRVRLTWTDHYGVREGKSRPRATVDLRVVDERGRELLPVAHNSERNDNGLAPDPVSFVLPGAGRAFVELEEIDGYADTIELLLERPPSPSAAEPPSGVVVHRAGDSDDAVVPTEGGVLLSGGGRDSDEATRAAIRLAGGGDAVIVRMDDTGGSYPSYFVSLGARSATEIVLDRTNGNDSVTGETLERLRTLANHPWIEATIGRAELLFFAGGNQTKYVDVFAGTRLAAAVNALVRRRGVVGGTSAGMHVLGGWVHTPRGPGSSVTSDEALADPYIGEGEIAGTASLAFTRSPFVVPGLESFVLDTHFAQRRRLGRSIAFLARTVTDGHVPLANARVVACDEGTAIVIGPNGPRVVGQGDATVIGARALPDVCRDDAELEWRAVSVCRSANLSSATLFAAEGASCRVATASRGAVTER